MILISYNLLIKKPKNLINKFKIKKIKQMN